MKKSIVRSQKSEGKRGFTLVEVLATIALIAIVLPVAMYGISLCVQTAGRAKRQAEAATLAEGKLQELSAMAQLPQVAASGNDSGDFGADFPDYKWQSTVTTMDLSMEQIDVRVMWTARNQQQDLTVSTWVFLNSGATTGGTG
ncbi:MAG TPA: type II secretion system protein [Tepidisphaeraceae bacterium]|jgi:type II secretion system protein I|nr:type II secretion system protein [Tepidisphaeraceae bacterium]